MKKTKKLKTEVPLNKHKGFSDFSVDHSISVSNCDVEIIFRNIKERLISKLNNPGCCILGCVAWLTDFNILDAMKNKSCGILIQKEDFLRPDKPDIPNDWKNILRTKYENTTLADIHTQFCFRFEFESKLDDTMGCTKKSRMGEIRCSGHNPKYNLNQKHYTKPLMHNKFLVLGEMKDFCGYTAFIPKEVWTGSFNMSSNANHSLENVVLIKNEEVAIAYTKEWANLYLDSESLDWKSEWHKPDPDEYSDYT